MRQCPISSPSQFFIIKIHFSQISTKIVFLRLFISLQSSFKLLDDLCCVPVTR